MASLAKNSSDDLLARRLRLSREEGDLHKPSRLCNLDSVKSFLCFFLIQEAGPAELAGMTVHDEALDHRSMRAPLGLGPGGGLPLRCPVPFHCHARPRLLRQ